MATACLPRSTHCTPDEWFKARIVIADRGHATPCWLWAQSLNEAGYGNTMVTVSGAKFYSAHRLSHVWFIGPIPAGFEVVIGDPMPANAKLFPVFDAGRLHGGNRSPDVECDRHGGAK